MASKFIIREKSTNSFCTSSKHYYFSDDLDSAVLFASRENAEKAVKEANKFFYKEVTPYGGNTWVVYDSVNDVATTYYTFIEEYIKLLQESSPSRFAEIIEMLQSTEERGPVLEVVEVKLCIVA